PGVPGQVLQRLQRDGVPLVGGQAGCPGGGGGAGRSCRAGRRRSRRCGRSAGRGGSAAGPGSPAQGCGSRKFEEIAPFHGSCLLCGMSLEGAGFGAFHCYHNTWLTLCQMLVPYPGRYGGGMAFRGRGSLPCGEEGEGVRQKERSIAAPPCCQKGWIRTKNPPRC